MLFTPMPVLSAWDRLLPIVMDGLPTDVDSRANVLEALTVVVPDRHPARDGIAQSLWHLNQHLIEQTSLDLVGEERGSGRLGHTPMERGASPLGDQPKERGGRK